MKSHLRQLLIPEEDVSPLPYPMATYRAWAPVSQLEKNPALTELLKQPASNVWLGPVQHVIFYPAESGKILAINGTYPSRKDEVGAWNKTASIEEVQQQFHEFDPRVKAVLAEARDCKSWALAEVPRLPQWASRSGKDRSSRRRRTRHAPVSGARYRDGYRGRWSTRRMCPSNPVEGGYRVSSALVRAQWEVERQEGASAGQAEW